MLASNSQRNPIFLFWAVFKRCFLLLLKVVIHSGAKIKNLF